MDTEVYKIQPAPPERFPYRVEFGHYMALSEPFATFPEALAFYRGYNTAKYSLAEQPQKHDCRIINTDMADGSEDGRADGLTDDEREAIQNAE